MINIHFQNKLILFICLIIFSSCKHEKAYQAELFDVKVNLNELPNGKKPIFSQRHLKSKKEEWVGGIFGSNQFPEWNEVLYNDTVIRINPKVNPPTIPNHQATLLRSGHNITLMTLPILIRPKQALLRAFLVHIV